MTVKEFVLPTTPADIKKISDAVEEAYGSLIRAQSEKNLRKDISASIKEDYGMPPAFFNKLVKTYFDANYAEVVGKSEEFEDAYVKIMQDKDCSIPDELKTGFVTEYDAE